jgi:hypothetical protein
VTDSILDEWVVIQRRVLRLMSKKDFAAALNELEVFMSKSFSPELRSEVFAFRGRVRERMGEISSAKDDFLFAHSLVPRGTYRRYTIELTLGRLSELMHGVQDASFWYLQAVETAAEDLGTSGASAVEAFLGVKGVCSWTPAEKESCEKVLRQAWELFCLPGEPNFDNLQETLAVLGDASTRPLPSTGPRE